MTQVPKTLLKREKLAPEKLKIEKKANLYIYFITEGYSKKEAFLKLHPKHVDSEHLGQLIYGFENNKFVKARLKMFQTDNGIFWFSERNLALKKQYEIGMGLHGGSLKTQADALNQFITNTQLPQDKSRLEELQENESLNKSNLLKSIKNVFDNLGKENIEEVEVIENKA